jgi:hypothetical protein
VIRKTIIVILILATIATAGLWIASCMVTNKYAARGDGRDRHGFNMFYRFPGGAVGCVFVEGEIIGMSMTLLQPGETAQERRYYLDGFQLLIHAVPPDSGNRFQMRALYIPFWFPLFLFAAYPVIAFIRGPVRRRYRRKRGLCPHCGYNLTGNTTGICPECGKNSGSSSEPGAAATGQITKRAH